MKQESFPSRREDNLETGGEPIAEITNEELLEKIETVLQTGGDDVTQENKSSGEGGRKISRRALLKGALGLAAGVALSGGLKMAEAGEKQDGESKDGLGGLLDTAEKIDRAERRNLPDNLKKCFPHGSGTVFGVMDAEKEGMIVSLYGRTINEDNKDDYINLGATVIPTNRIGPVNKYLLEVVQTKKNIVEMGRDTVVKYCQEIDDKDVKRHKDSGGLVVPLNVDGKIKNYKIDNKSPEYADFINKINLLSKNKKGLEDAAMSEVYSGQEFTEAETTVEEIRTNLKERITSEIVKLTDGGYAIKNMEKGKAKYKRLKPAPKLKGE